jgi:hypothetical protein
MVVMVERAHALAGAELHMSPLVRQVKAIDQEIHQLGRRGLDPGVKTRRTVTLGTERLIASGHAGAVFGPQHGFHPSQLAMAGSSIVETYVKARRGCGRHRASGLRSCFPTAALYSSRTSRLLTPRPRRITFT